MKSAFLNTIPFLGGATITFGWGIGTTRRGSWPTVGYGIFEWEPWAAYLAMAGLIVGGAGLGATLVRMIAHFAEGELRGDPKIGRLYWWENGTLSSALVATGAMALFIAVVVVK